jgi:hypothetical protein
MKKIKDTQEIHIIMLIKGTYISKLHLVSSTHESSPSSRD